jgi:predicted acetyltransferase
VLELALPSEQFEHSFLAAEHELALAGHQDTIRAETFSALIERLAFARAGKVPPDRVPATTLWLVDDREFVGRITIRHYLSDALRVIGGHIGYTIRPSRRGQGLGTQMLALALPAAHALGIDPAMITCDGENLASRRVIERNGGVFAEEFPYDGRRKLRFWIATKR